MEQLDHQTSEALECSRNADRRADFDEDPFGGVDVNLQSAGLVDGRVEESKQTLETEV